MPLTAKWGPVVAACTERRRRKRAHPPRVGPHACHCSPTECAVKMLPSKLSSIRLKTCRPAAAPVLPSQARCPLGAPPMLPSIAAETLPPQVAPMPRRAGIRFSRPGRLPGTAPWRPIRGGEGRLVDQQRGGDAGAPRSPRAAAACSQPPATGALAPEPAQACTAAGSDGRHRVGAPASAAAGAAAAAGASRSRAAAAGAATSSCDSQ